MEKKIPNDVSFRVEQTSLRSDNFQTLRNASNDALPEALLQYICYEHQYNLFGYGKLDPVEFASEFRFQLQDIMSEHSDPFQIRQAKFCNKPIPNSRNLRLRAQFNSGINKDNYLCSSKLENALYILNACPLSVNSYEVDTQRNVLIHNFGSISVLESFSIIQNMSTGKVTYLYKLDERFRKSLANIYMTVNRESMINLRRSSLVPLYLFIISLRNALRSKGLTKTDIHSDASLSPQFEYLCKVAFIKQSEPRYMKRDLNAALKKIRECTELQFRLTWESDGVNNAQKYIPVFDFGDYSPLKEEYDRKCSRVAIAINEFVYNLIASCPYEGDKYDPSAEEFFYKWLSSDDPESLRGFAFTLTQTFVNIGCVIPPDVNERVMLMVNLASRKPFSEMYDWMAEIFSGPRFDMPRRDSRYR